FHSATVSAEQPLSASTARPPVAAVRPARRIRSRIRPTGPWPRPSTRAPLGRRRPDVEAPPGRARPRRPLHLLTSSPLPFEATKTPSPVDSSARGTSRPGAIQNDSTISLRQKTAGNDPLKVLRL